MSRRWLWIAIAVAIVIAAITLVGDVGKLGERLGGFGWWALFAAMGLALANYGAAAGLDQGVELRLNNQPKTPDWSRSTFNGLAQIIVRTTKQPGTLELTARAAGLASATLPLAAASATPRPSVD